MTAVTPRLPLGRLRDIGNPFTRFRQALVARLLRREELPRPPAYVVLCATVTVLNVVGLVMILSASSVAALSDYGSSWYFFNRQLMWAILGLGTFLLAARIDYRHWRRFAPYLLVFAFVTLSLVLVGGKLVSGSQRWIVFGPLQLQPSEIAKLALLVCGAEILTKRADRLDDPRAWRPVVAIFLVFAALVMKEPDLASTIVLGVIVGALLIVGGVRAKHLAQMIAVAAAGTGMLSLLAGYRRARMFSFLHPGHDVGNTGYQLYRSLIAIGSGGLNGVGLGAGRAKWFFLPNAHTDFIFAIIGEELGFIGCLLVLGLFVGLGLVGLRIARRAPDRFGMLIATGVTAWIVGQAAINLGAVVGLLPVSGVPLPFLSVGGTSLVITMFGVGVVANIARQTAPSPARARSRTPTRPVRARAS
ncbi:MAG TPA: putative lipid II flippase FtsW [Acidimicrobiia bacterium]|jgi:cell division protein FtsW|nr:putative lipid II flippase FtsW [Acidimicrobiia bacterium]